MQWLADENLHGELVEWLRRRGDDVAYIAEDARAAVDPRVLDLADVADRVVLTQDKDFGEWVFAFGRRPRGVVLLRLGAIKGPAAIERFAAAWAEVGPVVEGNFVVVTNRRVRVRPIPTGNE